MFCFLDYFTLLTHLSSQRCGGKDGWQWVNILATALGAKAHALPQERVDRNWCLGAASLPLPGDRNLSSLSAPSCGSDTIPNANSPNFVTSNNNAGPASSFQVLMDCKILSAGSVGCKLQGSSLFYWLLGRQSQCQGFCSLQILCHQSLDHLSMSNGYECWDPGDSFPKLS